MNTRRGVLTSYRIRSYNIITLDGKKERLNKLIKETRLPLTKCIFENTGGMYLKFNLKPEFSMGILLEEMDRCNDARLKKIIKLRLIDFAYSILDVIEKEL